MVQYAQKECHDCHGIFPGNEMVRIGEERETGRSYRDKDAYDESQHRIYRHKREVLVCRNCRWRRRRNSLLRWIVAGAAAIGLYSYVTHLPRQAHDAPDQADGTTNTANASDPSVDSDWKLADTTDPMNDVQTQVASRDIQGQRYTIQTEIKCVGFENILYEFSAFDSDDKGVEMTSPPDATALIMMKNGVAPLINGGSPLITSMIRFAVRADDGTAQVGTVYNPRYANRLIISTRTIGMKPSDLAGALHLLIRLPTKGGEETIDIDQTDSNVASVLQACNGGNPPAGTDEFNGPQTDQLQAGDAPSPSTPPNDMENVSDTTSDSNVAQR